MMPKISEKEFSDIAKGIAMGQFFSGPIDYDYDTYMSHGYDEATWYESQKAQGIAEDDMDEWEPVQHWEPFVYWPEESVAFEVASLYDTIMRSFKGVYDAQD